MFLVDNERGKEIQLNIAGRAVVAGPSGANGHFHTTAYQSVLSDVKTDPEWLTVTVSAKNRPEDNVTGRIQLVPAQGLSVISDIDDTIKHSQVLDKSELVANTFVRPFSAVPGMAELYQAWERDGAAFHYVSSSPWQLYPFLRDFMSTAGFPLGSFHLKLFRLKDETVFNITASSLETKPPVIRTLFDHYPQRAFILVGDSGEHDAEIYGDIAREFPGRVRAIYIRHVTGSDVSAPRFAAAFRDLPNDLWHVFDDNRLPTGTEVVQ
jgi:phosphatidate phosphatase APP1